MYEGVGGYIAGRMKKKITTYQSIVTKLLKTESLSLEEIAFLKKDGIEVPKNDPEDDALLNQLLGALPVEVLERKLAEVEAEIEAEKKEALEPTLKRKNVSTDKI